MENPSGPIATGTPSSAITGSTSPRIEKSKSSGIKVHLPDLVIPIITGSY